MSQAKFKTQAKGNYLGGEFRIPKEPTGEWTLKSPANFNDVLAQVPYSYADVDEAVSVARNALKAWRRISQSERGEFLKKYRAQLEKRSEELAEIISREMGKPLWESKTEVTAMMSKVDISLNESAKLISPYEVPGAVKDTLGVCRYKPLGVAAVIGPFNFPGHLANGHIVPALMTGNTVIFKPSEKTPLTGQLMAECFRDAGFPAGVFNLLQGEKEVGRRLCVHEGVDAILFTGSYEVGTRIKQDTLQQHWKLLALEMGGKNSSIVWSDADFDLAVRESLVASFITTGQRCSCTSRIIVHESIYDRFVSEFHKRAKAFAIGHPLDNPFMGPLIEQGVMDRYMKFQGIAEREGCELLMRGKALELQTPGNYVTPSICLVRDNSVEAAKKSVYQQTELFAPNVAIIKTGDLDHAAQLANVTQYGLVTSVFSQNRDTYLQFWDRVEAGLINWNRSTTGASSKLPFGGIKKSGNHWPTAVTAPYYCTYPVASLESDKDNGSPAQYQGLNWT